MPRSEKLNDEYLSFINSIKEIKNIDDLDNARNGLNKIIEGELKYYNHARKKKRKSATNFINTSLAVFISITLIAPSIANFLDDELKIIALSAGYVSAALLASALLIDRIFRLTKGQSRYVLAALKLEEYYATITLEWSYNSSNTNTLEEKCGVLSNHISGYYRLVNAEVDEWNTSIESTMTEINKMSQENMPNKK